MTDVDQLLERPHWRGRTNVDRLTVILLEHAEQLAGKRFTITQGSYNTSVNASAGTHAGGGALDLRWTWDDNDILALRLAGFAAWHRDPDQGPWTHHIHAVVIDHPALSPAARRQTADYARGLNGLANHRDDDGPRLDPQPTWKEILMSWQEPIPRWDGPGARDERGDTMWAAQQLNQARGFAIAAYRSAKATEKAIAALANELGPAVAEAVADAFAQGIELEVTTPGEDS